MFKKTFRNIDEYTEFSQKKWKTFRKFQQKFFFQIFPFTSNLFSNPTIMVSYNFTVKIFPLLNFERHLSDVGHSKICHISSDVFFEFLHFFTFFVSDFPVHHAVQHRYYLANEPWHPKHHQNYYYVKSITFL